MLFYFFDNIVPHCFSALERVNIFRNNLKSISNIQDANFCFCPIPYECLNDAPDEWLKQNDIQLNRVEIHERFQLCNSLAKQAGKKMFVLYYWDPENFIEIDNVIFIRTSVKQSDIKKSINTIIIPAWHLDEVDAVNNKYLLENFYPLEWSIKPSVGFRGIAASYSFADVVKHQLNNFITLSGAKYKFKDGWPEPYKLRKKVLDKLQANNKIQTDFSNPVKQNSKNNYKTKFIESLQQNQYSVCIRGFGNYSFRFYETIAAGRIPIFLNTDCALPLENIINYKKYFLWIEENEIEKIDKLLIDYHFAVKDDFESIQTNIKNLWLNFLSPEGFFKNFETILNSIS